MLQIDLKIDDYVYDMMKGNPKLDFETVADVVTFHYRDKYKMKWVLSFPTSQLVVVLLPLSPPLCFFLL